MQFTALAEVEGRLELKRKELNGIFEEAGPELDMSKVKSLSGEAADKIAVIQALNAEAAELGAKAKSLRDIAAIAEANSEYVKGRESGTENGGDSPAGAGGRKSLGELFTDSVAYKGRRQGADGPAAHMEMGLKDLLTTASFDPETTRTGRIVDYVTRPLQLLDLIPQNTTSQVAVVYMEETTFTNNADAIAEGGPYPESTIGYTQKESAVRKIGTYMSVTDEALEDAPYLRGRIDQQLPFMVGQKLEAEVLSGTGTAPHLRGLLSTSGILTQALGGDTRPDAIYKALTKVRVTGQGAPNFIALHPNDWQDIRLMKDTTGVYIWGHPSIPGDPTMWGLTVAEVQLLTEGTGVVGDSRYCELAVKRGIDVQITNSHNDDFTNGRQAIRADVRAAFVVYRPSAFATITGI